MAFHRLLVYNWMEMRIYDFTLVLSAGIELIGELSVSNSFFSGLAIFAADQ